MSKLTEKRSAAQTGAVGIAFLDIFSNLLACALVSYVIAPSASSSAEKPVLKICLANHDLQGAVDFMAIIQYSDGSTSSSSDISSQAEGGWITDIPGCLVTTYSANRGGVCKVLLVDDRRADSLSMVQLSLVGGRQGAELISLESGTNFYANIDL